MGEEDEIEGMGTTEGGRDDKVEMVEKRDGDDYWILVKSWIWLLCIYGKFLG